MSLCVFVLQLDLLNLDKGDHDFFRGMTALHLQVEIIGGDAADPLADIFAARALDHQYHVAVRIPADDTEEAGELRLDEAAVEGELAALVRRGWRQVGLFLASLKLPQFRSLRWFRSRQLQSRRMLRSGGLHRLDRLRGPPRPHPPRLPPPQWVRNPPASPPPDAPPRGPASDCPPRRPPLPQPPRALVP